MKAPLVALLLALPLPAWAQEPVIDRAAGRIVAGDRAGARTLLESVAPADPNRGAARTLLAALDLRDGRDEGAVTHAREATRLDPSLDAAWRILCAALVRLGRRDLAAEAALEWSARAASEASRTEALAWHDRLRGGALALGAEASAGFDSNVRLDPDAPGTGAGSARTGGHVRASIAWREGASRAGVEVAAGQTHHFDAQAEPFDAGFVEAAAFGATAVGRRVRLAARAAPRLTASGFAESIVAEQVSGDGVATFDLDRAAELGLEVAVSFQDLHGSERTGLPERDRDGGIVEAGPSFSWGAAGSFRVGVRARYRREALESVEWRAHAARAEAWTTLSVVTFVLRARVEWLGRRFTEAATPHGDSRVTGDLEIARPWGGFEPFVAAGATDLAGLPTTSYRRFVVAGGIRYAWEGW